MPKSKIKFYQESSKKISEDGEIEITWKVINDSEFDLEKVKATSQLMEHSFGKIDSHKKEEFKFSTTIPSVEMVKEDFGPDAVVSNPFIVSEAILTFTIKTDTFDIKSNSLEIPF